MSQVLLGLQKQFMSNFVFSTWACVAGFNNNNEWCSKVLHEILLTVFV